MAQTTSGFQLWKPEIDSYIEDELSNQPDSLYAKIFKVKGTDRLQVNDVTYSGPGAAPAVGEMGDAVEDDDLEGYKTSYNRVNYRKKKTFSSDLLETDQTGEAETMARNLARVPEYTRNLLAFSTIRKMATATQTYGDGKTLLSIAHPRKDGSGTQSNTFSDAIQKPVDYDAALELQNVLNSQLSNKGNLLNTGAAGKNKVIFGGYTLKEKMFQIAGIGGPDKKPGTDENDSNYFRKGDRFDVLVIPWINYEAAVTAGETAVAKTATTNVWDTMWGIMDVDVCQKYFKFFYGNGYAKFDDEVIKSNQSLVKYVYDKFAFGVSNWIGFAGSLGDNSALAI